MTNADPGREVLADLLQLASEAGPDRLVTTDRLLREIVGPDAVNEAHRAWTARVIRAVEDGDFGDHHHQGDHGRHGAHGTGHDVSTPEPASDVFDLTRRLRATRPGARGRR